MDRERNAVALLQTLPGNDLLGAAMLVEIGTDRDAFGNAPPKPSIMTAAPSRTLATATSTTVTILPIIAKLGDNRTITFPPG